MKISYGAVLFASSAILPSVNPWSFGRFYFGSSDKSAISGMPKHLRGAADAVEQQLTLAHDELHRGIDQPGFAILTIYSALDDVRNLRTAMGCGDTVSSHACSHFHLAEEQLLNHMETHFAQVREKYQRVNVDKILEWLYHQTKRERKICKAETHAPDLPGSSQSWKLNVVVRIVDRAIEKLGQLLEPLGLGFDF